MLVSKTSKLDGSRHLNLLIPCDPIQKPSRPQRKFGVQQAASYDKTIVSATEALNERTILRNPLKLPNLN
jgi:hypothetical protein